MHSHYSFLKFLGQSELSELYASIAIRAFALSLVGIFIPIYLYQIGYSFATIFLFFALCALWNFVFLVPAAKLACRIGLKHSILLSMPFLIGFFLMLFSIQNYGWSLYLISALFGIYASLFWVSYHTDFSRFSEEKSRGKQVGAAQIIISVFSAAAPLVGGLILHFFGFKVLFISVSLLLFASTFPLFLSEDVHEPLTLSLKDFFKGQRFRNVLAYIGNGAENRITTVVFPLFVFVFILREGYISLGALSTVVLFFSVTGTYLISKISDANLKFFLKAGSLITAAVWFVNSYVTMLAQLFTAQALYGISTVSLHVPFDALNYNKANKSQRMKIILERELYIKIGAVIILLLAAIFVDGLRELIRVGGPVSSFLQYFF